MQWLKTNCKFKIPVKFQAQNKVKSLKIKDTSIWNNNNNSNHKINNNNRVKVK